VRKGHTISTWCGLTIFIEARFSEGKNFRGEATQKPQSDGEKWKVFSIVDPVKGANVDTRNLPTRV
jgi:hypothetical protein